ncbi:uncharacterized protein PAC_04420 [Phialocephala subalpina]|uniref:DUF7587 domain-containing protein n=1 Tax=Phialocephala subalpina TaxID=576137 RepID=A0A1L7WP37_9HELO|nr:uncharacterized protein PAC_04420 [Phialocephala subalpina]
MVQQRDRESGGSYARDICRVLPSRVSKIAASFPSQAYRVGIIAIPFKRKSQATMSQDIEALPSAFYRVQHHRSYTVFQRESDHASAGFTSNGHYLMNGSLWINKEKIESHLVWKSRPLEPSPYISVFDNLDDARKRAQLHSEQGKRRVFIARIETSSLRYKPLDLQFQIERTTTDGKIVKVEHRTVHLPAWVATDGTTFIPVKAAWQNLWVDRMKGQKSEWLALDHIPMSMITEIQKF